MVASRCNKIGTALVQWSDERSGFGDAWRRCSRQPIPGGPSWSKVWPGTILFAFCVQAITGFFIWIYYVPTDESAWESVYYLQHGIMGGWLLRAVHHYSAQLLLVLIGIYLVKMIFTGACRAPREFVFWTAVFMGLCTLGLLLTGDLLAWDQSSYASTYVRVSFLKMLPFVGGDLFKIAIGGPGPAFGHLTLPRFLALHVGVLSGGFIVLLVLHRIFVRRANASELADPSRASLTQPTEGWWPQQAAFNGVAWLIFLGVVLALALQHGVGPDGGLAMGSPADLDPANKYAAARPEWAFLGLYEFSHLFPGELAMLPIFIFPGLLVGAILIMPLIGRYPIGRLFNMGFTATFLVGIACLSFISLAKDRADEGHQAAILAEIEQANRTLELVRLSDGIPAGGALGLLHNDAKTQGPGLFAKHCASCHNHADAEGNGIVGKDPSAPNLFAFASRDWITGILDAKRVAGADYFGNTEFKRGSMVGFVKETLTDLDDDEKTDVASMVIALSAEAGLKSQKTLDADDTARIAAGRALIVGDYGCADCHKLGDEGSLGGAPDLTGYGSREWIVGIISNPTHRRFYGENNDRMPAYAEFPNEPAKNAMTAHEVGLLADWLRGEWLESKGPAEDDSAEKGPVEKGPAATQDAGE